MLHSRARRVPDERDADLGVLRAGRRPASLEEHREPLRTPCQVGSDGAQKMNTNWDRFLDLTP